MDLESVKIKKEYAEAFVRAYTASKQNKKRKAM